MTGYIVPHRIRGRLDWSGYHPAVLTLPDSGGNPVSMEHRDNRTMLAWLVAILLFFADIAGQWRLAMADLLADAIFFSVAFGGNALVMLLCLFSGKGWPGRIPGLAAFGLGALVSPVIWVAAHFVGFRV